MHNDHTPWQTVQFRPRRLGHANLFVSSLEPSMRFYTDVCGLEEVFREPGIKAGFVGNGNTHHDIGMIEVTETALFGKDQQELVPKHFGKKPGLFHLGLEMENEAELVAAHKRAVEAGVRIMMTVDHGLARSVFAFDSEGNLLELYADTLADWRAFWEKSRDLLVTGPWTPGDPPPSSQPFYHENPEIRRVSGAVFSPRRITHAALAVRDFEGALDFYREVVGLKDVGVDTTPDAAFAILQGKAAGYDVILFPAKEGGPKGLHHVSFEIGSEHELDRAEAELQRYGILPALELDNEYKRSIFITDPDGVLLEFYARRTPRLEEVLRAERDSTAYPR